MNYPATRRCRPTAKLADLASLLPSTSRIHEEIPAGPIAAARYMKAIPVQPLCLTCHGMTDSVPDAVKARLAADYPHDRATGYALGQIRGAISIKQSLQDAR